MNQPRTWEMDFTEHVLGRPPGILAVMYELAEEAPERFLARLMIHAGELNGPATPAGLGQDAWEASYTTLLDLTPETAWGLLNVIRRDPARFLALLAFWTADGGFWDTPFARGEPPPTWGAISDDRAGRA